MTEGYYPKTDGAPLHALDTNQSYYMGALSTTGNYGAVTVTVAAVQIVAANASRKKILIINSGSTTCYIGVAGVTSTTGTPLDFGESIILNTNDAIFGAVSAVNSEVRYLEVE